VLLLGLLAVARGVGGRAAASAVFGVGLLAWIAGAAARAAVAILLSRIMGADTRLDPAGFDIGIRQSWQDALNEVEANGGKPYPIPAGASEHRFGGLGFANWAYEVVEQRSSSACSSTRSSSARSPARRTLA
jgi:1-aminocyclopropane-1-carboxylate deaminase/D-cysteine desulfhydrase-like pyridoxal-dependent ACC family enzyme